MGADAESPRVPIFRDIRRYYCDYCGICRSKKSLIASHIAAHHVEETKETERNEEEGPGRKLNVCTECGAGFRKPAHLKQHMQSHSLERPFTCPVDDCNSSYRRKDHLTRHLLQHEGKLFDCPFAECKRRFAVQGNMSRHVKKFHDESGHLGEHEGESIECPVVGCKCRFAVKSNLLRHMKKFHDESACCNVMDPKEHVCTEDGCGKAFKYPSKLRKHEDSHVNLETTIEAFCAECMKYFTNEQCLKEHTRMCHQHVFCDKCGSKQLKKNMKRHIRMHEGEASSERIECTFEECSLTFSTVSNLNQHIKAVHFEITPFACTISGCHMKFAFKHVRDNHEKSGLHVFTPGDFLESDEQFRSRPRGGRKRTYPVIESSMRKRVVPPIESDFMTNEGGDHPSLHFSGEFDG